jgi:hypothetical protein
MKALFSGLFLVGLISAAVAGPNQSQCYARCQMAWNQCVTICHGSTSGGEPGVSPGQYNATQACMDQRRCMPDSLACNNYCNRVRN